MKKIIFVFMISFLFNLKAFSSDELDPEKKEGILALATLEQSQLEKEWAQEKNNLQNQVQDLQEKNNQLNLEKEFLQRDFDSLKCEIECFQQRNKGFECQIEHLYKENCDLYQENQNLKKEKQPRVIKRFGQTQQQQVQVKPDYQKLYLNELIEEVYPLETRPLQVTIEQDYSKMQEVQKQIIKRRPPYEEKYIKGLFEKYIFSNYTFFKNENM